MKTKAVIFDYDGTLTKPHAMPNSWSRVWQKINHLEIDKELSDKYRGKSELYNTWIGESIQYFREFGVTQELFEEIGQETELLDNADKAFKKLYDAGIKIFILSGGIRNIIDKALGKLLDYVEDIEAQYILFDDTNQVCALTELEHNIEAKNEYVESVMKKYGLKSKEIVFFGNDKNDEGVCKTGAKTICLNPHRANYEDKSVWTDYVKNTLDMNDILQFIQFD